MIKRISMILRGFVHVVEEGGFAAAGRALDEPNQN